MKLGLFVVNFIFLTFISVEKLPEQISLSLSHLCKEVEKNGIETKKFKQIGHFRADVNLIMKARLSAKFLL